MRRKPEHASISFASTTRLPTRLNRVRKADIPHCTTCSVVCSCARLLLLFSSWLLCRRTLIAKGVTLSQIDLELTSQTVVFAFFFCRGATSRSYSIFHQTRSESLRQRREKTTWPFKSKLRLEAENAVLRHQLIVLRRSPHSRIRFTNHGRLFFIQLYRWFPAN